MVQAQDQLCPSVGLNHVLERCLYLGLVIFVYLICYDFRKINGRIKIFEKCTTGAAPHDVKSLPPWGTTAGAGFGARAGWGGAAPGPTAAGLYRCATRRQGLFFSFSFLKHF
jgi:hypothetical protein